jgi:hypothetical protein
MDSKVYRNVYYPKTMSRLSQETVVTIFLYKFSEEYSGLNGIL